jgi:hypothetical protein
MTSVSVQISTEGIKLAVIGLDGSALESTQNRMIGAAFSLKVNPESGCWPCLVPDRAILL